VTTIECEAVDGVEDRRSHLGPRIRDIEQVSRDQDGLCIVVSGHGGKAAECRKVHFPANGGKAAELGEASTQMNVS